MTSIYSIPTFIFGPLFVIAIVALAIGGHALIRRTVPHHVLIEHNDVAGFIIAVVGVIYAVALAFLVIVVWEDFHRAEITVQQEVDTLTDIYHGARVFPQAERDRIRALIQQYNRLMISEEWPAMQVGRESEKADEIATEISTVVLDLQPTDQRMGDERRQLLSLSESFLTARRARLHTNENGLPVIMWWTMGACGVLTIGFVYIFGVKNARVQFIMTGVLSALIAIMLLLIIEIDYPFRGDTSVSNDIWIQQQHTLATDR